MGDENKTPMSEESHACLHEADFISMNLNIAKMCKQMDEIHQEIMGPPGVPGIKAKVASQQKQLSGVFGILGVVGAAMMAGLIKIFFFVNGH
jgi:hypothetical protein